MNRPLNSGPEGRRTDDDAAAPYPVTGERFYRALVENTGDILTILDRNGTIIFQNPAVQHLLAITRDAVTGRPTFDFIHPDDRERIQRRIQECACVPGSEFVEVLRVTHKNSLRLARRDRSLSPRTSASRSRTACRLRSLALGKGRTSAAMVEGRCANAGDRRG